MTTPASATTSYSAALSIGRYDHELVVLAQLIGATGGTLDVTVQESWDSGVTWVDVCHFTQLAGAASAINFRVAPTADKTIQTVKIGTVASAVPVLAAGDVAGLPWGPLVRLAATAGSGTSAGASITVTFSSSEEKAHTNRHLVGFSDITRVLAVTVGEIFEFRRPENVPIVVTLLRAPEGSTAPVIKTCFACDRFGRYIFDCDGTLVSLFAIDKARMEQHRWTPGLVRSHVSHASAADLAAYEVTGERPSEWHDGAERDQQ